MQHARVRAPRVFNGVGALIPQGEQRWRLQPQQWVKLKNQQSRLQRNVIETHRFGADLELLQILGKKIQQIQAIKFLARTKTGDVLAVASFAEGLRQQLGR